MPNLSEFLQIAEAAEYLGVCQNTLRNWGRSGKIRVYRHPANNYRLFLKVELDEMLNEVVRSVERIGDAKSTDSELTTKPR